MTTRPDFEGFPKIGRLYRDCIITEKIDGTNAQILITEDDEIYVGSRKRWITPEDDNHGFARWVEENKEDLLTLGPGRHFGEWWGAGIQRKYGLTNGDKRFSLFNVTRWCLFGKEPKDISSPYVDGEKLQDLLPECVGLVPVLFQGVFSLTIVRWCLNTLEACGSWAVPNFMKPEGVVVYHEGARTLFKATIENDERGKG